MTQNWRRAASGLRLRKPDIHAKECPERASAMPCFAHHHLHWLFFRFLDMGLRNALWNISSALLHHVSLAERGGWLHLGVHLSKRLVLFEQWCETRLHSLSGAV